MDDRTIRSLSDTGMLGGVVGAFGGFLTTTEWMAVIGAVVAVLGLILSWWHKRQMVKIERERLELEKASSRAIHAQEAGR